MDTAPAPDPTAGPVLGTRQRRAALAALLRRTAELYALDPVRYPLYREDGPGGGEDGPRGGQGAGWVWSRRGSWTPGFRSGLVRLAALTGHLPRRAAEESERRLRDRLHDDTVTRAMTFWYGAPGDAASRDAATGLLLDTREPASGLIPVGTAWGAGPGGRRRAEVDCWAPLVRLLCRPGGAHRREAHRAAAALARTALESALTGAPGGRTAVHPGLALGGPGGPAPEGPPVTAGRPFAWALLGLAECAAHLPADDERTARLAGDCARAALRMADQAAALPSADTSADAITALALLKLAAAGHPGRAAAADRLLHRLVTGHLTPDGALTGARYPVRPGVERSVESVWGAYFLAHALAVREGVPGADEV
ncbi:hypothetical protein C6N75_24135 [Streptomyces solincola]|uniref:Uncharacterized protein n=2 Tax=Streptomyces solincola TaxID=2100817 RepID=A0A2S9PQL5_9ACTN|nr:hypothetical protein C6N75_24135 [Streptomyces solincola]